MQLLPNTGCVVSVSMFTTRGIVDCPMFMNWKNRSTFISQRKVAAVAPGHWSPTYENVNKKINTLDKTRGTGRGCARVYAFPHTAIVSEPNCCCRVFACLIGLDHPNPESAESIPHPHIPFL
jgi:hypothetical protein